MDVVHQRGEASVAEIRQGLQQFGLAKLPSYSAVRTMVTNLETSGFLKHRKDGKRYLYSSTETVQRAGKRALLHLVRTFFRGSAADAFSSLLNENEITDEDLRTIEQAIKKAKRGR